MMFIKKAFLGSLSFATVLIVGNWSGAIAQSYNKSERFLSDREIQALESDFQKASSSRGGGRPYQDSRSATDIDQINQFIVAWQKSEALIAPFLGDWAGFEESLSVYPSTRKDTVCIVHRSYGRDGFEYNFNLGKVVDNKLVSDGQLGKVIILRKSAPDRSGNKVTFLANYRSYRSIGIVSVYAFPSKLKVINDSRFTRLGCTASLPSQVSDSHSNGYLSDQEIESIQPSKYILRQLQYYTDKRSKYEIEQITQFRNNWSTLDPSLAPFLGRWQGYERSMVSIYPSSTKGKSCVITSFGDDVRDSSGIRTVYTHTFGIGKISGNKLLVETENGEKSVVLQQIANTKNGRINILAALAEVSEENSFFAFAFPRLLEPFRPEKLRQFGCTTLPPQNSSRNNDRAIPSTSTTIAKYPTNDDFNAFEDKLQGNPESLVKLRGNQAEQRRKFQNDWKASNPNAAKFLGAWYTGDRYFYVFPSTAKGGTCVVTQDANGKLDMKIGVVLNQELRYDGGKGFFWRDRPNIIASRDSGSGSLYPIYATFATPELPENMIGDMERQKCITSLPFDADAQYYKERGDQFAKVGKKDDAISNYRKAIELYRKQNQLAQVRNIESQIVKLGGTNTTTSTATVYRNTKELGLAQLTGGDKKITTAYDNLVRASQGNYSIPVNTSNIEFLKKTITTLRPADCQQLGFSCSEKQISFSDYLELKQKISKQKEVFEGALSISEKFNAYGERLNSDTRNGGKNTLDQISQSTQKIWDEAQSKARARVNLSLNDKLSLALVQTKDDLLDFTVSLFKTSTKTVAALVQLDEVTKIVGDVRAENLNRFAGAPNYILSVQNNLKGAGQAFLQADGDKIRDSMLKTAQSTIEYINLQDSQISKSANVIKIYSSAKDFIDQDKLLRQPQLINDLDSFDKFYLYAAQMSKGLEIAIAGVSIPLSSSKADSLLKKVDIGNTLIFDALEFSYKNDLRRRYARLLDIYNRNQFLIIGMQSYQDYAATEVGNYLVKARTDVVSRRSDGSISVSTKGIIYPPQN